MWCKSVDVFSGIGGIYTVEMFLPELPRQSYYSDEYNLKGYRRQNLRPHA